MTSKLSTRPDYRRALLQPLYTALRAGHITHFYFIAPDRRMVLRMQSPQRHGDESTGCTKHGKRVTTTLTGPKKTA
jgi:hypothetical protein